MASLFLCSCHPNHFHMFFILYKGLSENFPAPVTWENFSVYLIALEKLIEVFGCSIITDFTSTMFGFPIVFGC